MSRVQKAEDYSVPHTLAEWNRVKILIKSTELDDMEECLRILSMWCSRMDTNIPIVINCTVMCLHAAIKEKKMKHPLEGEELKLIISMVIIRFINYVADSKRTTCKNMDASIYALCEEAGLPRWIVELRHNASHLHLPQIGGLKRALDVCRTYLYQNFWSKSMHEAMIAMKSKNDDSDDDEAAEIMTEATKKRNAIIKALNEFLSWRFKNLLSTDFNNCVPMRIITKSITNDPHLFLNIFLTEGFFFLSPAQAKKMDDKIELNWEIHPHWKLLWKPVLTAIISEFYSIFVVYLLKAKVAAFQECNENIEYQAASWAVEILERSLKGDKLVFNPEEWSQILNKIVQAPVGFNASLIERVMSKVTNVDKKIRRQVRKMIDISLSESLMDGSNADDTQIYTASDLEKLIQRRNRKSMSGQKCGRFTIDDPIDDDETISLQMGLAPGQDYATITLYLDNEWLAANDAKHLKGKSLKTISEKDEEDLQSPGTTFYGDITVID